MYNKLEINNTSALFFILKKKIPESKDYFIAGIFSSLAYLTRNTGISLSILLILLFLYNFLKSYYSKNPGKSSISLKPFLYFFIPVIITVSLWGFLSLQKTGSFFYNMNFQNTAFTVYKPEDMSKDEWNFKHLDEFKSMTDVVFKDFSAFSKRIFFNNLPVYFKKDMTRLLPMYLGMFVVLGLIMFLIQFRKTKLLQKYFVLSGIIIYLQILLIFYAERFSIPLLPVYSFLIVWFFGMEFLNRFNFKIGGIRFFALILISLILFNFYSSLNLYQRKLTPDLMKLLLSGIG